MWVVVTERIGDADIGLLDNEPCLVEPRGETSLVRLAEVPFRPEHVIDIDEPPRRYVELMRQGIPARRWPSV